MPQLFLALRYKQSVYFGTSAHLTEITETQMHSSAVKETSARHWAEHAHREQGVEEQLELGGKRQHWSEGAIGGAQRKEDRKKY